MICCRVMVLVCVAACVPLGACESAYYGAMEQIGWHKRDLLVDRVAEARDGQEAAKEQFQTALDRFAAVVKVEGGELETQYKKLSTELERAEARAREVHDRVAAVEDVAGDLFEEWNEELRQYKSPELRRSSESQLRATRQQYQRLIDAMKRAELRMEPVLSVFRDQVLFLKHNLNARAVASIQGTVTQLESDVSRLLEEMQASINEADSFLRTLRE